MEITLIPPYLGGFFMRKEDDRSIKQLQVIGLGPSGLGVAIGLDATDKLTDALTRGVVFIDQEKPGAGTFRRLKNVILNSSASDFYEGIATKGNFTNVLTSESARTLRKHGQQQVQLGVVADFMDEVGQRLVEITESFPASSLSLNHHVDHIRQNNDGTYVSIDNKQREIATSESVVLAVGGIESLLPLGKHTEKIIFSQDVLSGEALQEIERRRKQKDSKIVIAGNSHSGLLVAHTLLQEFGDMRQGELVIIGRHSVEPFFETKEEAAEAGITYSPERICSVTGRVNRFGGPRGFAKDLYLSYIHGNEDRLRILHTTENLRGLADINNSHTIIQAVGYSSNSPHIIDMNGDDIGPAFDEKGRLKVNDLAQIQPINRTSLSNVYATGLGTNRKPSNELGGEEGFEGLDGVNVFHHVGKIIADQIAI